MAINPLGSFSIMTAQPLGKVLSWLDFTDIYHLSLTGKTVRKLVDDALRQVPYVPRKKGLGGLANTADVFISTPCVAELGRKWRVIRNLLVHGEQLDTLACRRADWMLIEACFNRLTLRIQELAKQWLTVRGVKLELATDLNHYRTPKNRTYLMLLASAGQWALLAKYAVPENPVLFEMSDDGETLLTILLLKSLKSNDIVIPHLTRNITKWGGDIKRAGDDRALALAAYKGRWDLVDLLLQREADPTFVTKLPDGTEICPLTSFVQHHRTNSLHSEKAQRLLAQLPELGVKCLSIPQHPFPAHLIDEEPELFVKTLSQCDQKTTYYHPFSYHKEYPIQLLPEAEIEDFPAAVEKLTEFGADINDCADSEESVPFLSRWIKFADEENKEENEDVLQKLISKKNISVNDGRGATPLHYACEKENSEILKVLLETMSPNERIIALLTKVDHNGFSPAMVAANKKGKEIYNYVCSILDIKELNAYQISYLLLERGLNPVLHLRTICTLFSREPKTMQKYLEKLEKRFVQSEEAASVIAELCPSFALQPMQQLLGRDNWQIWVSKVWTSDSVALIWTNYFIMHPEESQNWRCFLANLYEPLSCNKQKIAEMLVFSAANDADCGRLVHAWIEKFGRMKNAEKPLLELYLEEGGRDKELIQLLQRSLTPSQLELMLMDLWGGHRYIESDICVSLLTRIQDSGHPMEASFKRAADLWRLTVDDEKEAKALIEKEDL